MSLQFTDEDREAAIERAAAAVEKHHAAGDLDQARQAWAIFRRLVMGRSREQVARMEAERGLA